MTHAAALCPLGADAAGEWPDGHVLAERLAWQADVCTSAGRWAQAATQGDGAGMIRTLAASALYFSMVFAAGFLLGPIRVVLLEPRIGPLAAVLCEAPFLIAAIVFASRAAPRMLMSAPSRTALVSIGLAALALQQAADLAVGSLLRGLTLAEQIARLATVEGMVYVVLLALFAAMPLITNRAAQ